LLGICGGINSRAKRKTPEKKEASASNSGETLVRAADKAYLLCSRDTFHLRDRGDFLNPTSSGSRRCLQKNQGKTEEDNDKQNTG
jgi:hypothetical protein